EAAHGLGIFSPPACRGCARPFCDGFRRGTLRARGRRVSGGAAALRHLWWGSRSAECLERPPTVCRTGNQIREPDPRRTGGAENGRVKRREGVAVISHAARRAGAADSSQDRKSVV